VSWCEGNIGWLIVGVGWLRGVGGRGIRNLSRERRKIAETKLLTTEF